MDLLRKIWWTWGMILTISFISWGLLENYIRENTEAGIIGSVSPFFVMVFFSYLLGAAFRNFWWIHIPSCREHRTSLVCPECQKEVIAKSKKLDRQMKGKGGGK
jgi:hypothetical protein